MCIYISNKNIVSRYAVFMGKSTQYQRAYVNIKVDTNVATVCFMPEHNLQVILKFNQNKYKEKFQGKEV